MFPGLFIIMQANDISGFHLLHQVAAALLRRNRFIKITGHQTPVNDLSIRNSGFEIGDLGFFYFSVWWTEQRVFIPDLLRYLLRIHDIFQIRFCIGFPTIQMMITMTAHCMSLCYNLPDNFRVFFCIFTQTEKCCFCVVFFQLLENPWGDFRVRTVIKSKIYRRDISA